MKMSVFSFIVFISCFQLECAQVEEPTIQKELVKSTQKISLPDYPTAHNPSLIETEMGLFLTFRWMPDPILPWISYIGIVKLDDKFQPISKIQLLNTRLNNTTTPSQSEDARIFYYQGELYLIYNDNPFYVNPTDRQRRDIYVAKLLFVNNEFVISEPLKLFHKDRYISVRWQKNWVPFEWQNTLLMGYSIIPHEVLYADLETGECFPLANTPFPNSNWEWEWGKLRGGTPASLLNGEYLAFFHSSLITESSTSRGKAIHHYYMGAYTFSAEPPFDLKRMTATPLVGNGFYTESSCDKRVVFPGGYIVRKDSFFVAYGKDDQEIWIAMIDREMLNKHLIPISKLEVNLKKKKK